MLEPSYIKGLTLLGGEPFDPRNQEAVVTLLRRVKKQYPQKSIWAFTGYLYCRGMLRNDGCSHYCHGRGAPRCGTA